MVFLPLFLFRLDHPRDHPLHPEHKLFIFVVSFFAPLAQLYQSCSSNGFHPFVGELVTGVIAFFVFCGRSSQLDVLSSCMPP